MAFSLDEIEKIAKLARLFLTNEEKESLKKDMSEITHYVDRLQKIDVSGVEPMAHPVPMGLLKREDEAKEMVGRKGLEGSAGFEDGLIRVPKVIG